MFNTAKLLLFQILLSKTPCLLSRVAHNGKLAPEDGNNLCGKKKSVRKHLPPFPYKQAGRADRATSTTLGGTAPQGAQVFRTPIAVVFVLRPLCGKAYGYAWVVFFISFIKKSVDITTLPW